MPSNIGDCSSVQQMSQESHGVGNFSPKCVNVSSSARLFMTLHIPPMLQTTAINLESKSFVGQCICYHFPRRDSNWKPIKLLKCEVACSSPHPSTLDYLIVRESLTGPPRAFQSMVALVPALGQYVETILLLGLGGMTGNELCWRREVLLAELTSASFRLRFLFHFPGKAGDTLYWPDRNLKSLLIWARAFFSTFSKDMSPDQLHKEVRFFPIYLSLMFAHHLLKFLETQWAVSSKFDITRGLKYIGPWTFHKRKVRPKFWSPQKVIKHIHQKVHERNQ